VTSVVVCPLRGEFEVAGNRSAVGACDVPTMYPDSGKQQDPRGSSGEHPRLLSRLNAPDQQERNRRIRAHNPKVVGSNPTPATNLEARDDCVSGPSVLWGDVSWIGEVVPMPAAADAGVS
jgi:hypothetical protein